jgi:hypothetical protein
MWGWIYGSILLRTTRLADLWRKRGVSDRGRVTDISGFKGIELDS